MSTQNKEYPSDERNPQRIDLGSIKAEMEINRSNYPNKPLLPHTNLFWFHIGMQTSIATVLFLCVRDWTFLFLFFVFFVLFVSFLLDSSKLNTWNKQQAQTSHVRNREA